MVTQTTPDCWLIRFLDDMDKADLYIGRFRVIVWFAAIGYIVLHACGVVA